MPARANANVYIAAANHGIKGESAPARAELASEVTGATCGLADPRKTWWVNFLAGFGAACGTFLTAAVLVSAYVLGTSWCSTTTCLHAFGVWLGLCVCRTASRAKSAVAPQLCTILIWITRCTQRSVLSAKEWYAWLRLPAPALKRFLQTAYDSTQRSSCSINRRVGQKGSSYWRTLKAKTSALWTACANLAAGGSILLAPAGTWLSSAGHRIWESFPAIARIAKAAAESEALAHPVARLLAWLLSP